MTLNSDDAFFRAAQDVSRTHSAYRRRAHRSTTHKGWLATGTTGVRATNAAEILGFMVEDYKSELLRHLPGSVTRQQFSVAKARLQDQHDQACVQWQLYKLRHPGAPIQTPPTATELASLVQDRAADFRRVVDDTKGLPRRVKDSRRNQARDRLAASLCALNHAVTAIHNPRARDLLGATALTGLAAAPDP